ncbi:MAG: hypothetical protein IKR11_11865, partial [Solobacterium sp.]|nr:hypothetical protein [Solobacterium sp.]
VKEMVDKRINELEGMVANQSEMIKKQDRQLSKQSEMLNEQNSLLKEQKKNLSDAVKNLYNSIYKEQKDHSDALSYVAKIFGLSEKEALELIHTMESQNE